MPFRAHSCNTWGFLLATEKAPILLRCHFSTVWCEEDQFLFLSFLVGWGGVVICRIVLVHFLCGLAEVKICRIPNYKNMSSVVFVIIVIHFVVWWSHSHQDALDLSSYFQTSYILVDHVQRHSQSVAARHFPNVAALVVVSDSRFLHTQVSSLIKENLSLKVNSCIFLFWLLSCQSSRPSISKGRSGI